MVGFAESGQRFSAPVCADALAAGARNLLVGCAGVQRGQRLLVVHEDPALGWYDADAPRAVAAVAQDLGASVRMLAVGCPHAGAPAQMQDEIARSDVTLFFARIGDQTRFCPSHASHVCVVSYARTAAALASAFGTRDHAAMVALKDRVNARLHGGREIVVTCPMGTDLRGRAPQAGPQIEDVTIRRFPMCVPAPVPAAGFSGQVVVTGWLAPTGSRSYEPACLALEEPVTARVMDGRIAGFDGPRALVARIEAHYRHVSARFGIDPHAVHSWHAGLHDGCGFDGVPSDDPDLWANTVFGSPDFLHFHTCGAYAPGEICWMIARPTVVADGEALWRDGVLTVS